MPELVQVSGCDNPQRRGDVVFVHGLNGDPRDYWGVPGSHWPAWLGEDLPDVGVWSLGYENAAFKPRTLSILRFVSSRGFAMPLHHRAKIVLLSLELEGIGSRPLVFVTHSMGGLLVKQLLHTANESRPKSYPKILVENTRGVCFVATPHIGADLAKWMTYFRTILGTSVAVDELRPHEPLLLGLKEWYYNFVTREGVNIKTLSFYEIKPLPVGGLVVEPGDADPGVPDAGLYPLDENHRTICKPKSKHAAIHLKTVAFVRECLQPVSAAQGPRHTDTSQAFSSVGLATSRTPGQVSSSDSERQESEGTIKLPKYPYPEFSPNFRDIIPPLYCDNSHVLNIVFGDLSNLRKAVVVLPVGQAYDLQQRGRASVLKAFERNTIGDRPFYDVLDELWPMSDRPTHAAIGDTRYIPLPANSNAIPGLISLSLPGI